MDHSFLSTTCHYYSKYRTRAGPFVHGVYTFRDAGDDGPAMGHDSATQSRCHRLWPARWRAVGVAMYCDYAAGALTCVAFAVAFLAGAAFFTVLAVLLTTLATCVGVTPA